MTTMMAANRTKPPTPTPIYKLIFSSLPLSLEVPLCAKKLLVVVAVVMDAVVGLVVVSVVVAVVGLLVVSVVRAVVGLVVASVVVAVVVVEVVVVVIEVVVRTSV